MGAQSTAHQQLQAYIPEAQGEIPLRAWVGKLAVAQNPASNPAQAADLAMQLQEAQPPTKANNILECIQ